MPIHKQRDYTPEIKKILIENEKTFEFFVMCLLVMVDLPETDRNMIAKFAAKNAAKHYFQIGKDKAFQRVFKNTLVQTLTQDFDPSKAKILINVYTHLKSFQLSGLNHYSRGISKLSLKSFAYREHELLNEEKIFVERLNLDHYTFPDNHFTAWRIFNLLYSLEANDNYSNYRSITSVILYSMFLATIFLSPILMGYQYKTLLSDLLYNESSKITFIDITLLTVFNVAIILTALNVVTPFVFNHYTKEGARVAEPLKQELINSIRTTLTQTTIKTDRNKDKIIYHFPLFTSPALNPASKTSVVIPDHTTPAPRAQPRVKTHGTAFSKPVHASSLTDQREKRKDMFSHKNIYFYRVFNQNDFPTQHFIGLDTAKLNLNKPLLKKTESLLEHPQLVTKQGRSGIVDVQDEKRKSHSLGFFKIKNKGADERLYTNSKTKTMTLDNETITLHTANIIKRHVSRKNH